MPVGGARPGAGRKKGAATRMNEKAREEALKGGISPLEYLLSQLRDENNDTALRMDAAKAAAPYVHAKLANVDMNHAGEVKATVTFQTVYEGSK